MCKNLTSRNIILSIAVIVILGFAVYGNSLSGVFFWDDNGLIKNNPSITSWTNIGEIFTGDMMVDNARKWAFYRPIQMVTYMIDYFLWKLNPMGYHLTNILLHIAAALSVYWLIYVLFADGLLSLLTGILFVIHPVHTEAVAYISGRADSLSLLFMLLCYFLYIKNQSLKITGTFVLMLLSYALALLSKESSLNLPVLLLLYHFSFKEKLKVKEFLAIVSLALIYTLMRATFLMALPPPNASYSTTLVERLPGFFVAVTNYIRLLFLPLDLHMEYGSKLFAFRDPGAIFGAMILFFSLIYAFRKRESDNLVFFSIAWFLIALLPVSNLYPINAYMAEHWLYLPSIGFFLIVARALSSVYKQKGFKMITIVVIVVLTGFYASLTVRQNMFWKEPTLFYKRSLQYAPDSPTLYNNLGNVYWMEGRYDQAIAAYQRAIAIKPDYALAYYNLGNAYKTAGKNAEAMESYEKATTFRADYAEAYYNLGVIYKDIHENTKAVDAFKKAIKIKGDYTEAHNNLGAAYLALGRNEDAIASYEQATAIRPDYADAYFNLGVLYNAIGRRAEAIAAYNKAIEIKADDAEAYYNLGRIYASSQMGANAAAAYKKAIEIKADYTEAYNDLGNVYRLANKNEEAIVQYEKIIEIDPHYAIAYANLSMIYLKKGQYSKAIEYGDRAKELGLVNSELMAILEPYRK